MKDSVGSTVLMKIFVVFMVVYIILMASILNYTKTFRIKNQVINIINRNGGYTKSARDEITEYISKSSIYGSCNLLEGNNEFGSNKEDKCEIKEYQMTDAAGGSYYKVRVYVTFMFPLIKQTLQIPITGETKRLYGKPLTPGNGPRYDIVNRSYNPNDEKVDLGIENDSCIPDPPKIPQPNGGGGCCSTATCGSYKLGGLGSGCACYDEETGNIVGTKPTYVASKPGRIPSPGASNACCFYYTGCTGNAILESATAMGTPAVVARSRTVQLTINDPNQVGMSKCSTAHGSCSTTSCTIYGGPELVTSVTITCVDATGKPSDKTVVVNVKDCGENCTACTKNDGCTTCESGYYVNNKACKKCGANCAECNGPAVTCSKCEPGYRPKNVTRDCEKCTDSNCLECPTSKGICMKCAEGYMLSSGKCVEDKGKCYKCCVSQGCTYRWSETGSSPSNTCVVDSRTESKCVGGTSCSNISNCAECTSNSKGSCTACNRGYKLTNGNCTQNTCVSPCTLCDEGGNDCYSCSSGYYVDSNDLCSKCSSNWSGCTACNTEKCTACDSNHILKDSKCCNKKDNCSTYLANCNCDKCESGYETDGKGGCKKKSSGTTCQNITGCIQYNTSDCTCSLCNSAYNKKNGKCELKDDTITCTYPKYLCSNGTACCQNCSNASKPTCLAGKCTSCNTATGKWKACAPGNCLAQ